MVGNDKAVGAKCSAITSQMPTILSFPIFIIFYFVLMQRVVPLHSTYVKKQKKCDRKNEKSWRFRKKRWG